LLAVGEEVVNDQTDNREEKDEERPEDLVTGWTGRLENFDENKDVENQNDETEDTAASAIAPGVRLDGDVISDGGTQSEGSEEGGEDEKQHCYR